MKRAESSRSVKAAALGMNINGNAEPNPTLMRSNQIEFSERAPSRSREMELCANSKAKEKTWVLANGTADDSQYTQVMRELKLIKQELTKLKREMDYVLDQKSLAECKNKSLISSTEVLRDEIEEANEEQVLVELARIEAVKELGLIQAQREEERTQFSSSMENTQNRIHHILRDIDDTKELQNKLAVTTADVHVLQNELNLVKAMDRRLESKETSSDFEEVEAARKELQSIRDEGFQFMASMDIIRQELKHVSEETARLKSIEENANPTVQNLNSKILRATSKLEALSIAEENAKEIVSNLSSTLQQLTTEGEAAKKQRELISEEAENIRAETLKIESETDLAEAKLIVAMKDLEEVKSSETFALADLKNLSEKTMRDRASASQHSSSITISHFEYKYLMGRAEEVEKIADKKVAAAQAWIEALKASEKEILMKTDIAHREMRELKVVEVVEGSENMQLSLALPRKSMKDNGNSTPMRRGKPRRPSSPGSRRTSRSGSIMIKRRTKVMPNLGNLFGSKRTGECA